MSTSTTAAGQHVWGGLAEPLHLGAAGPDDPRYLDTAYLGFWSDDGNTFGVVHLMTSPNAEGRRARCSLAIDGKIIDVIEPLDRGTLTSPSIDYDVFGPEGDLHVDHPEIGIDLTSAKRFGVVGFEPYSIIPALEDREPLMHYEIYCDVEGTVRIGDESRQIRGRAFRDRSWGFRDEHSQVTEWAALCGSFETYDIGMIKVDWNGEFRTLAYINDADGSRLIDDFFLTRDAAGMFKQVRMVVADGDERVITPVRRLGEARIPMASDREGPTLASWDEYLVLDCAGERGGGYCEQGVLHRVW